MSLISQIFLFIICYVLMIMLLAFLSKKTVSLVYPMRERKNNLSFTFFALLCFVMVIVIALAFFTLDFCNRSIGELLKSHYFVFLSSIFVIQFFLSAFFCLRSLREVVHLFQHGSRQVFPVIFLVIILSYVMISVVI